MQGDYGTQRYGSILSPFAKVAERLRGRLQSGYTPVQIRTLAWRSGHSGGETPVPIPNTEDKPVYVPCCTEVREPSGTMERCYVSH